LLDGSIYMSLESAGVTTNTWWSFSNSDGSWYTTNNNNCGGGTSGSGSGRIGHPSHINSKWITNGNGLCSDTRDLICIAKP
ncbi:MAG: hypothetical protein VW809_10455, partial [Deltaproteobacteria bacterium]